MALPLPVARDAAKATHELFEYYGGLTASLSSRPKPGSIEFTSASIFCHAEPRLNLMLPLLPGLRPGDQTAPSRNQPVRDSPAPVGQPPKRHQLDQCRRCQHPPATYARRAPGGAGRGSRQGEPAGGAGRGSRQSRCWNSASCTPSSPKKRASLRRDVRGPGHPVHPGVARPLGACSGRVLWARDADTL